MSRIIVLGSINMDVVVTAERHPQLGETVFGDELHFIPGGKGSNQAVAANRLGGQVQLIGRLGQDAFGDTMHDFLTNEQLDLTYLARLDDQPTGTALITVNSDSENTIVVISGANKSITPEDIQTVKINADDVIVSQFEVPQPTIKALFEQARAAGAQTVLNPAPAGEFIDGLLPLITHLVVNETELAFLSRTAVTDNIDELTASARSLRHTDAQIVIVTLGKRGVLCVQGDDAVHLDGHAVKAVDTTGAGDCFVGALAVGLGEKQDVRDALAFANRAAAVSVQRLGAATSLPTRDDVKHFNQ